MHQVEEKELSKIEIATLINVDTPLILEIGAYDGKDSKELCRLLVSPVCFCFEADPRSQELFCKQNKHNNLILERCAVGNVDGLVDFYKSGSKTRRHKHNKDSWSASSSLRAPKTHLELFEDVFFEEKIQVECIKLDTWHRRVKHNIDFIWCDINGAEEDLILGGLNALQEHTKLLYIEFSDKELYEGQIKKDRILELLSNFELIGIYNYKGNFGNMLLKNKTL
jgi:FkbM family methyltransferase